MSQEVLWKCWSLLAGSYFCFSHGSFVPFLPISKSWGYYHKAARPVLVDWCSLNWSSSVRIGSYWGDQYKGMRERYLPMLCLELTKKYYKAFVCFCPQKKGMPLGSRSSAVSFENNYETHYFYNIWVKDKGLLSFSLIFDEFRRLIKDIVILVNTTW